jgi:tetratricopeptide (TPR) repeat protein
LKPDPLAAYLRARAADADGAGGIALADYRLALDGAPGSTLVALRTYREAVSAGDLALVDRAAAVLAGAGMAPMDAALFPLARAAQADDAAAATTILTTLGTDRLRVLVPALRGWIAFAHGQDGAATVDVAVADPAARRLAVEARALLLLAAGRVDEGLAAVRTVEGRPDNGFHVTAAELLIGAGRATDAAAILADDRTALVEAQAGAPARPTLAFGVARLLLRVADDLSGDNASPAGLALARAALVADPGYARAHLVLADRLAAAGEPDRAGVELDVIAAGPLAALVAERRVALLDREDRPVEALAAARALAEAPAAGLVARAHYADLLVANDRAADSLPWYRGIVEDPSGRNRWAAWLRYGSALDEAGRWPAARKALRHALTLAPDEPGILNYLGYNMVDRHDDVPAGTRLLERAHALVPDDAAIADSLGWAYFRGGDVARALPLVESAATALPADTEVADHLGDLYWTLGRRYEARYQWRAALVTASPTDIPALTAKLAR